MRRADGGNGNGKPPRLVGILTRRDLKFQEDDNRRIGEVMTKENLVTAPEETTLEEAERILYKTKVEKLLLVDKREPPGGPDHDAATSTSCTSTPTPARTSAAGCGSGRRRA